MIRNDTNYVMLLTISSILHLTLSYSYVRLDIDTLFQLVIRLSYSLNDIIYTLVHTFRPIKLKVKVNLNLLKSC